MKSLILIVLSLSISWQFIDLESDLIGPGIIAPLVFITSLAWLAGKMVIILVPSGKQSGDSGYYDSGDGGGGCGD